MSARILVIIKGGMVDKVYSTSDEAEITIIDEDVIVSANESKIIYYKSKADKIIGQAELDEIIEEAENEQLNFQ